MQPAAMRATGVSKRQISWSLVAEFSLLSFAGGVVAAWFPVRNAANKDIPEVLRAE